MKYINFRVSQYHLGFSIYHTKHIMELLTEWFPYGKFRKVDSPFRTENKYEKEIMDDVPVAGEVLWKE